MAEKLEVVWTPESKYQIDLIIHYLRNEWGEKTVDDFLDLIEHFERIISGFPFAFKESEKYKGCRAGLIHNHVTAVYQVYNNRIVVVTVFDNRSLQSDPD